jgi:arylformamidase
MHPPPNTTGGHSSPRDEAWIDVTVPIRDGMVHFPGDPEIVVTQTAHLERGDDATVSKLSLGVHTGTHVDAPVHFILDGAGVDRVPLERLMGPARVIELGDVDRIGPSDLDVFDVGPGERLLFKTKNSRRWAEDRFRADYVCLSPPAARLLAERGVWTIGIDYLSIGGMDSGVETHRALLEAGVCIIEGLDLSSVESGSYDLVCLPLRLEGLDGAPARVILRRVTRWPKSRASSEVRSVGTSTSKATPSGWG